MSPTNFSVARLVLLSAFVFISSSPHNATALYPYKHLDNSSHLITLKPEEWTSEYTCESTQAPNATDEAEKVAHRPRDCYREPTAWRFNYVLELEEGPFKLLVEEGSLDERAANIIYSVSSNTGLNLHGYTFNSANQEQDLQNERLVAGPQVDDAKCVSHLNEMISLLEEIKSKINLKRNETNQRPHSAATKLELGLQEPHFRLARALDSFGQFESGTLSGRYHAMGIYQQCITTPLQLANELIPSRYCWAHMSLDRHLSPALKRRVRFFEEGDNFKMMVAVCLPESCHSKSFNPKQPGNEAQGRLAKARLQQLIDTQFKLPESLYYERNLELESVFCLVDEDSNWAKFPVSGKLFLVALVAWLALIVFATHRRRRKHRLDSNGLELAGDEASVKTKSRSLLNNLDIFESWLEFIGARDVTRESPIDLDVLNPIKFIGSMSVVLMHSAIIMAPLSRELVAAAAFSDTKRFEMLSMSGFVVVDTFFVISGILMTFIVLKKLAKQKQREKAWRSRQQVQLTSGPKNLQQDSGQATELSLTNGKSEQSKKRKASLLGLEFFGTWFFVSLHRYLRLVPLFFVVFCFKKTVFNHLGSGPLWDWALNKDTPSGGCRLESWATPFSFNSAFLPMGKQCLPPTWSLSNDLFFSLFTPPLIILFFKRPRIAKYLTGFLIVAGCALSLLAYYSVDYFYRFEVEQIRLYGVTILITVASQLYTNPIYRTPAMLVGIISGYALFRYEQRASTKRLVLCENHQWSWWFRRVVTPAAFGFIFISTTMSLMLVEIRDALGPERTGWLVPMTMVSYHVTWSISNAVLLLRMLTDWKDSLVMQMCAGRFWRVLSKLTFASLLVHWDLLMYEASSRTSQVVFTRAAYFSSFAMAYFWTIPLSIFLYVIIENPIDKLIKSYLLKA